MTQELLKELFEYRDGDLYWKVKISPKTKIGTIAGWDKDNGYKAVTINTKKYLTHRIIWMYHFGYFPKNYIDHINGIKNDNRIENLREATNAENQQNRKKRKNTSSLLKGITFHNKNQKWVAQIVVDGNVNYLGSFKNESAAAQAYNEAAIKHFGEFALINKI